MGFRERLALTRGKVDNSFTSSASPIANDNEPALNNSESIELFEKSEFFGIEHIKNSPACLELRFSDGSSRAAPYSFILEIWYEPSEGIEIKTTLRTIKIIGRNLKKLYLCLVSYRVSYIAENIGNDLTEESQLFVKEIKLEEN